MHDRFRGKTTKTLDAIDCYRSKRRSEPTANNRPEYRGLHPVGALARTHRKKSLPIGERQEKEAKGIKDPNLLHAVGPNLGGSTQWVRWRAPTGNKLHQLQSGFSYTDKEETLRMTLRITRRF